MSNETVGNGDAVKGVPAIPPTHSILLSVEQVCAYLGGVSKAKVFAMASAGRIPRPKKIDRLSRWLRSDLDRWAEQLE